MARFDLKTLLTNNTYPGRGILIGQSADGKNALIGYFIMGRSENSRNRVFECFPDGMRTKAFDNSKLSDPRLIIYNPFRRLLQTDIVTNGDQTDTIYETLKQGGTFEDALMTRTFEPDAPNYTPRISGMASYAFRTGLFSYELAILKSAYGDPSVCHRFFYRYTPRSGIGHFIHTYRCDGNPIPSFEGDPEEVALPDTGRELADLLWTCLNPDNKVSLYVRQVPLDGSAPTEIVINKLH